MTQPYDERAERKRYIRRRQQIVFSCVGAVLAVALVVSALFYFHVGGLGITATSAVKPNYGVRVPCSTKDANGKNQTYSNYANVKVRVLNGTNSSASRRPSAPRCRTASSRSPAGTITRARRSSAPQSISARRHQRGVHAEHELHGRGDGDG